ncbi:MAG: tetratricopeptide repeat protein [Rhodopila sp.]|jgi:class 3 adenylate cyclase/tetratricopeptide (TPR) repeat protein
MYVTGSSDLIGRAVGGRKLIAVVYVDMVGYSRLIQLDDMGTLERLRTLRSGLIDPEIYDHGGRIVQTGGDSLLIIFDSIEGAVCCAVNVQQQVPEHESGVPPERTIRFRIGINIGDVIADGTNLHGDGVNVAARLQAACPPGGICVSRAVRDHVHDRLDLAFDELGALSLKNITRPVEAFILRLKPEAGDARPFSQTPPACLKVRQARQRRLSVMVAPLRSLGISEELEHLVEGITEDFTADLSQLPGTFVVGGAEARRRFSISASPTDLARELGLAYVIQGSIRASADRIGVSVQLIDTGSGAHIWAERFDVDPGGTNNVRDDITGRLVRVCYVKLTDDVNRRIESVPPQDWTPYDLVMRGRAFTARPLSKANRKEAITCFEQALDGDPDSVDARIGIAFVLIANIADGWSQSAAQDIERAEQLLLDVLHVDGDIFYAHIWMGVLRRLQGRLDESLIELETALALAPNYPVTMGQLGVTLAFLGQPEAAIPHIERSLLLAPHDAATPLSYSFLGICHVLLGRIEEAVIALRKSRAGNSRFFHTHLALAAALGLNGEVDEAAAALREAIQLRPGMSSLSDLRRLPWLIHPKFIALFEGTFCVGLRRAGLLRDE